MPAPSLIGAHQQANAALAWWRSARCERTCRTVNWRPASKSARAMARALAATSQRPAARHHQRARSGSMARTTRMGRRRWQRRCRCLMTVQWHFICGALDTRPPAEFLSRIAPHAASIRCVAIPDQPASLPAETLAEGGEPVPGRARPIGCWRLAEPGRRSGR